MTWQIPAVMPNIDMALAVEARQAAIVPAADPRVAELRARHPNLDLFLGRFRGSHGRPVAPSVLLLDEGAPDARRTGEAMVGLRNALAVATVVRGTALELLHPQGHRILFSDPFDFYPWNLDRHFDRMISITPASLAMHRVDDFAGQPSPGSPIHTLNRTGVDRVLLAQLLAHWDSAYAASRTLPVNRALFRSLNMAHAAMRMPATTGATIFDYGRHCALWISAFEILAHLDAGRVDLPAVLRLLGSRPFLARELNARRHRITFRGRRTSVGLAGRLYERLYRTRNDFLHGNPVTARSLRIPTSGRLIGHFAPLLYRCALRNFLALEFAPERAPVNARERIEAAFAAHRHDDAQRETEEALLTARVPPPDD